MGIQDGARLNVYSESQAGFGKVVAVLCISVEEL